MKWSRFVGGAALALGTTLAWVMIPPFPAAAEVIDYSLPSLTTKFGAPNWVIPAGEVSAPVVPGGTKLAIWERPRGIAVWTLQVQWESTAVNQVSAPHWVFRYLRVRWPNLIIPWGLATRGQVATAS